MKEMESAILETPGVKQTAIRQCLIVKVEKVSLAVRTALE